MHHNGGLSGECVCLFAVLPYQHWSVKIRSLRLLTRARALVYTHRQLIADKCAVPGQDAVSHQSIVFTHTHTHTHTLHRKWKDCFSRCFFSVAYRSQQVIDSFSVPLEKKLLPTQIPRVGVAGCLCA